MTDKPSAPVVLPPATIGIFGSGQLGKMITIVAKQMGYRVAIFSPGRDTPAGQVADIEIQSSYQDVAAVERFAQQVDVITLEFENVPVEAMQAAAQHVAVYPGNRVLEISQHRSKEKKFVCDQGIPTCQFATVSSLEELRTACQSIMPGVLKTVTGGYDGKGQYVIRSAADIEIAWESLKTGTAILEEWIEYEFEFSVIGARSSTGQFAAYDAFRNEHRNQILDVSISPAGLADQLESQAKQVVHQIMDRLNAVGVLCVEFFYRSGEILVNEIAPRPHNSGHLTIEGHATSQFEQHVRAVCGLPLGCTKQIRPAAMANLLGDVWTTNQPNWSAALEKPETALHLYGKQTPVAARKMGHITSTADSTEQAKQTAIDARSSLG